MLGRGSIHNSVPGPRGDRDPDVGYLVDTVKEVQEIALRMRRTPDPYAAVLLPEVTSENTPRFLDSSFDEGVELQLRITARGADPRVPQFSNDQSVP